jgi:hypothetical protein
MGNVGFEGVIETGTGRKLTKGVPAANPFLEQAIPT